MDILSSTGLYGWITSLIRRRGRRKLPDSTYPIQPDVTISTISHNYNAPLYSTTDLLEKHNNENKCTVEKEPLLNHLEKQTKMDKSTKKSGEKSEENSIEEDIEEAISVGSIAENSSNTASGAKLESNAIKKRQLFDIDDDDNFAFDDDQLSGKKLVEHFKIDDVSSEKSPSKRRKSRSKRSSKRSLTAQKHDDQPSLTNQSTTHDVSELGEENSLNQEELYTRSLDLGNVSERSYEHRDCRSLDTVVKFWKLTGQQDRSHSHASVEKDRSVDEVVESNQSIETTFDDKTISSLGPEISKRDSHKLLSETPRDATISIVVDEPSSAATESGEDIAGLKQKILAMTPKPKIGGPHLVRDLTFEQTDEQTLSVKPMERVQGDFSKEVLEDITEESEKVSAMQDRTANDFDSIISLNMIQMIETEGKAIAEALAAQSKENSLDSAHRRESYANNDNRDSLRELPPSGRDSCSLATNSTEYRTILDELGTKGYDFHTEIARRDNIIDELRVSLEQSVQLREQLQQQSEKLASEVQQLRKYFDNNEKPYWPRDQESTGQRLSEISLDLVSESDEDYNGQLLTDEEKVTASSRNSKERQLGDSTGNILDTCDPEIMPISKQIEQFQKYLNTDELRIFFMVQKKFDDFLSEEVEKSKMKYDGELKVIVEQLENEKHEREIEINRLQQLLTSVKNGSTELIQLRQELEAIHAKEMDELRRYFQQKCADLEKQYSEEVFSQKSQRNSNDTNSDISDQENLPDESIVRSKEGSPRKRTREELYASPSHRQITPVVISNKEDSFGPFGDCKTQQLESHLTTENLNEFYKEKIEELSRKYEDEIRKLKSKLRRFEAKYAADEFMKNESNTTDVEDNLAEGTSTYLIIDEDEDINESQEIRQIVAEYERRLQEQVALAKEDTLQELGRQIQALISESTTDDQHWPQEIILLREKFTAKSQLEITQLQIKHEEEMSRLKSEYEKQLNRKTKRNSTFDLSRDLDQIVGERENLRELSNTFRYLLSELAKYVSVCEDDLNNTLIEELHKIGANQENAIDSSTVDFDGYDNNTSNLNQSYQLLQTTLSKKLKFAPDVSGLLSIIEDPELVGFIKQNNADTSFNLKGCLEKLNAEANQLLQLSEDLLKKRQEAGIGEKNDSCEEEDGLKSGATRSPQKILRASSLNGDLPKNNKNQPQKRILSSLPPDLNRITFCSESILDSDVFSPSGPASELNFQVHELKNRLLKSESDRHKLQTELETTIRKNIELGVELNALREQLEQLDSQKEDYSEGYGLGGLKSPPRLRAVKKVNSFSQLQEKARNILSTPTKMSENTAVLLQLIEDFCREGDKVAEQGKKDRDDLQSQIEAADKQLKSTRQFLDEQAAERELEREDFIKEIENLKNQIRDKEKERSAFEIASREITKVVRMKREAEQMEQQIKDLTEKVNALEAKKEKLEVELEASVDKIFVLRDIISDLETQVQAKTLNERVMSEKVKELEAFIDSQNHSNEALQQEVISLKSEIGQGYQEKIAQLEEQLRNARPTSEQSFIFGQLTSQLRDIETSLDQKIKTLEALHQSVSSISCSTSPTEDVSVQAHVKAAVVNITPQGSPMHPSPKHHSLPMEEMQRVFDKLAKHTRVEEAAVKRIQDLEMHMDNLKTTYAELQNERDVLQERMSEQMLRITSLQSKLEEQRRRAEELQCQGTSELNIRIHDLQNEVMSLKETLSARDKQIINLKNHLEQSKAIIDRQEAELALGIQGDRSALDKLENELKQKAEENKKLKEKIKNEMIHKLALPDLMETMLADKNEEIDHLKEQLEAKDKELQGILAINLNQNSSDDKSKSKEETDGKLSGRTLSDIVSIPEYDEPDIIRRAPVAESETPLALPQAAHPEQTLEAPKQVQTNGIEKRVNETPLFASIQPMSMQTFDHPHYFQVGQLQREAISLITPPLLPRQINFSDFADDTKLKESTPRVQDITHVEEIKVLKENLKQAEGKVENLKTTLENLETDKKIEIEKLRESIEAKTKLLDEVMEEKKVLENKIQQLNVLVVETEKLRQELNNKTAELARLEEELKQHRFEQKENESLQKEINSLKDEVNNLSQTIKIKDEMLSKQEKDLINCHQNEEKHLAKIAELEKRIQSNINVENTGDIKEELDSVRAELSAKVVQYEKCLLDIQAYEKEIEEFKGALQEKDNVIATLSDDTKNLQNAITNIQSRTSNGDSLNSLKRKLKEEQERITVLEERNVALENEIEKLRSQNSDNSKPFSLDEIAAQVEKELNYSVQLDTNILKAIESEEEADFKTDHEKLIERDLMNQLQNLKSQLEQEKVKSAKFQQLLKEEKQHSQEIQQQDAEIVQAMRLRLEEALQKEQDLQKLLDEERDKCERLNTQISVLQRVEARKTSMLLKSPPDSPRKSPRTSDSESEASDRLKSEIKLLQAQNGRERERVNDLQRTIEREKNRFDTEINERTEYAEKLKREADKLSREKEAAEQEADHLQERLTLASREIESLEARISALQEAETRRAHRRGREKTESVQNAVDVQELKTKIATIETERDRLTQTIAMLRSDIERGAQREAKLAEALSNSGGDSSLPQQFLQKMKEMNNLLAENTKENRQMVETIQILIEERKILQKKVEELENETRGQNYAELEERANHLFGKYLRVESHRKALVHQKRYLLIVLRGYTESEAKAVAVLSDSGSILTQPRRNLFKTVALAIIAIQRMKFVVKRWHSGKRLVSRSIFNIPLQRKPAQVAAPSLSPPCRDTAQLQHRGFSLVDPPLRPLQTPGLITEYTQKFDWSRLKK